MGGDPLLSVEGRAVHARNGRVAIVPAARRPRDGRRSPPVCRAAGLSTRGTVGSPIRPAARRPRDEEVNPLLSVEGRAVHVEEVGSRSDQPLGAHVMRRRSPPVRRAPGCPREERSGPVRGSARANLTVGNIPAPTVPPRAEQVLPSPVEALTTTDGSTSPSKAGPQPSLSAVSDSPVTVEAHTTPSRDAHATKRPASVHQRAERPRHRPPPVGARPVAGAAGALVAVGLGGGGAVAIPRSAIGGSGSGQTTAAGPVDVSVAATTGNADLLPGRTGAAYFTLHNIASSGATFDQVVPVPSRLRQHPTLRKQLRQHCADIALYLLACDNRQSWWYKRECSPSPTLVALAPNAPNTCQGVTFTVTFTLSGRSS